MNPPESAFGKWLGIEGDNPDHFELLELGHEVTDPRVIKRAAKKMLDRLGEKPETPEAQVGWKMVRAKLRDAYHCLSDDKARAAYLAGLLANARKDIAAESGPHPNSDPTTDSTSAKASPADESEIPVALPIAEVVEEPVDSESIDSGASPDTPELALPLVNPARPARRRKSPLPKLLALIIVIGGGSYAIYTLVIKPQQVAARAEDDAGPATDSVQAGQTPPANNRSQEAKQSGPKIRNRPDRMSDNANDHPESVDESALTSDPNPPANPSTNERFPRPDVDTAWATLSPRAYPVELGLFHHLQEASHEMRRNDRKRMEEHFQFAQEYVSNPQQLDLWVRHRIVSDAWVAFWNRVQQRGSRLAALTELKIGEATISITESKPESLIYRIGGQRIEDEYHELPVLIALAILENALAEDAHDLLEARMVVYCVAAAENEKYRESAGRFLDEAEQAGLWVEDFRMFAADDWTRIYAPQRQQRISLRQIRNQDRIGKMKATEPVMRGLQGLSPPERQDRIRTLRDMILRASDDQHEIATIQLQFAIEACISYMEPDLLTEMQNLMKRRTRAGNYHPTYWRNYEQMAKNNLDPETARRLLKHIVAFHRRMKATNTRPQTAISLKLARDVAKKNGLTEELKEIERRYGENSSRNSGYLGI